MRPDIPWTEIGTVGALLLGVVNLILLFWRLGRETNLRKGELAMRIVEAEYSRNPDWKKLPAFEIWAFCLPIVDEVYKTGTFVNFEPHIERLKGRMAELMQPKK